jgi:hypothetical protein
MGGNPTNRATLDKAIPFVGFGEAADDDDIECRRLAAAARSQKREEFIGDSQDDTRQRGHAFVVRRHAPKLDRDAPADPGDLVAGSGHGAP